ncbi:hypothetical protein [Pedobacter agri]|uniref:hypothetical protein n=1 Tax=Pedobacter agri TaxID=454586 RepID=UPI0029301862|nr:hypothetical protein [Pedobacter agri]
MKLVLCWLFTALVPCIALSQEKIAKLYPVKKGQTVDFKFDYPKIIRVSNWDKNEISVEASIKVNGVAANDVFSLLNSEADGKVLIENKVDMDKVPQQFYTVENGEKQMFDSRAQMEAFIKEKGNTVTSSYQTKDIEILIDIKLPANVVTNVTATYGVVEVADFDGPITIDAKFGGIDARLSQQQVGTLKMTNRFGKIYTNYNFQPNEVKEQRFFTAIAATPGKGASYDFNSSFGNIYLRNP